MSDDFLAAAVRLLAAAIEHHAEALERLAAATAGHDDDDAPLFPNQEM